MRMRMVGFVVGLLAPLALPAAAPADGERFNPFGSNGIARVDVIRAPGVPGPNPNDRGDAVVLGSTASEAFVAGWTEPGFMGGGVANQDQWQQQQLTLTRFGATRHDPAFRSPAPPGYVYRGVVANFPGERTLGRAVAFLGDPNSSDERIFAGGAIAPNFTNQYDSLVLGYRRNGTLDPGFGEAGVVRTDPDGVQDSYVGAMELAERRLVLAGPGLESSPSSPTGTRGLMFVGKLLTDGQRDAEYGGNGFWYMVPTLSGNEPTSTLVNDMAVDVERGRIFICGSATYANGDMAAVVGAVRFEHTVPKEREGLDGRWNSRRLRFINTRQQPEQCSGIDVNEDGTVAVAVTQGVPNNVVDRILVYQFTSTGAADSSFGNEGVARIGLTNRSLGADALAFRADEERVYVPGIDWGAVGTTGDRRVLLARLRPNGSLDPSFDGNQNANGLVRTNVIEDGVDHALDMAVAPNPPNLLTLAGRAGTELLVVRYRP